MRPIVSAGYANVECESYYKRTLDRRTKFEKYVCKIKMTRFIIHGGRKAKVEKLLKR